METALLHVLSEFTVNFDLGKGTLLALLDLSAAFDTIDHQKLLLYLSNYLGFGDSALNLIKSYLTECSQWIHMNGILPEATKSICGVPQGPLQFACIFCC